MGDEQPTPNQQLQRKCIGCGGITRPMAILDSQRGRTFRLLRCEECEKMTWAKE